jgi:Fe2+ or Zn2+ uptake regulation protein
VGDRITRYDPDVHGALHHLVCTRGKAIVDVSARAVPLPDEPVDFLVESAEVIFRGRCSDCR